MPEHQPSENSRGRIHLLGAFLVVILACYVATLYHTQVTKGPDYLEQSVRTITRTERVEASRGILTDRNGKELVSNRQSYNLTFDVSLLDDKSGKNEAILRLISLCRQQGLVWEDNLPLTDTPPFSYTFDTLSDTLKGRFVAFLSQQKLASSNLTADGLTAQMLSDAGLTPEFLMASLRETFEIPGEWPEGDARAVLGVLYELEVRKVMNITAYVMVEDIGSDLIALLNDGDYQGAKVTSSSVREYETTYAAHILGAVGLIDPEEYQALKDQNYDMDSIIGKFGAESAFEEYLKGTNGRRVVSTNAEGKITGEYYSKDPQPGSTVQLTIDLELQKVAEDALAETISKMTAEDGIVRGAGVSVSQVGTGEVLALASYPTYDLATYRQNFTALAADTAGSPLVNRATTGLYPPGSTLKPLTAVAALETGSVSLTESIRDTGRWVYPGDVNSYANCWKISGHGPLNVTGAITNSCNYFFAEMGYRMGLDTLNQYLEAFGLGKHTGIEIGDDAGRLAENKAGENQAPWAAFGQANQLYTPLQLSNYIATLVSGGKHCQAHLLKAVKSYDNSEVVALGNTAPENLVEMKSSTVKAVKEGMLGLTTTGALAGYFKDCVVTAGAKTGTSQLGKNIENTGVFVCFAPYDDPEIAVSIVIEKGGSGAALASTAVKILNAYFTADQIGAVVVGDNQLLQ